MWAERQRGFTIVELLIVVVVIAILAAITIVAYTGIQQRARVAAAQSEASQAIKKLEVWRVTNGSNLVPVDAATAGITETDSLKYYASVQPDGTGTFCIQSKKGSTVYTITNENSSPIEGDCGTRGLLGWWKLNSDGSDASGNGNNGTPTATTSEIGQNGQAAQALGFVSSSTSNVIVPHTAALSSDPQTFSMWVRPTSWASATASTILAKRASSANGYFIAYLNGSSSLIFDCGASGGSNRWTPGYAPPLNTWTHLVFTCSASGGVALYVNGNTTPQATRPTVDRSAMSTSTSSLRFGQDPSGSALLWNGSLDDIRLYNRVLTPTEINNLFTANAQ